MVARGTPEDFLGHGGVQFHHILGGQYALPDLLQRRSRRFFLLPRTPHRPLLLPRHPRPVQLWLLHQRKNQHAENNHHPLLPQNLVLSRLFSHFSLFLRHHRRVVFRRKFLSSAPQVSQTTEVCKVYKNSQAFETFETQEVCLPIWGVLFKWISKYSSRHFKTSWSDVYDRPLDELPFLSNLSLIFNIFFLYLDKRKRYKRRRNPLRLISFSFILVFYDYDYCWLWRYCSLKFLGKATDHFYDDHLLCLFRLYHGYNSYISRTRWCLSLRAQRWSSINLTFYDGQ